MKKHNPAKIGAPIVRDLAKSLSLNMIGNREPIYSYNGVIENELQCLAKCRRDQDNVNQNKIAHGFDAA